MFEYLLESVILLRVDVREKLFEYLLKAAGASRHTKGKAKKEKQHENRKQGHHV